MNKPILCALILLAAVRLSAQSVPTPAPAQAKAILLQDGMIHVGNGKPAVRGDLLVENGKIKSVAGLVTVTADMEVIPLNGQHVYPGLIALDTKLGIEEVEAVRATLDASEVGLVNPNMRTLITYNADSKVTPTVRSNGVLLAQVSPEGGLFAGSSSVMQLDAWTWEGAAYLPDDAIHLFWPQMHLGTGRNAPPVEEQKKRLKENLEQVSRTFDEARAYQLARKAERLEHHDFRLQALIPVLEKKKPLWVHVSTERQIRAAVAFMLEENIRMVLVGAEDAWLATDLLKTHSIPVVLESPHSLPRLEDEDIDQPFKSAQMLHEAGVLVGIHRSGFWQQRNLAFMAGTAGGQGLGPDWALQLVTLNAARILGIEARTGSLEEGKDANIVVSKGDLLDMRSSDVVWACIQGRIIDLGNLQKDLYKKFQQR